MKMDYLKIIQIYVKTNYKLQKKGMVEVQNQILLNQMKMKQMKKSIIFLEKYIQKIRTIMERKYR